ncbi:pilus assembly protein [Salmonella enterica]|nr:pilus assembly protein [Salmonella enterica]EBK2492579.1 pilus assembly protein [Salmonella enterica subsp. enterica serovar Typhimurium]EAB4011559.1 pilus assembly protein [Salmonella enterica]EAM1306440.1 pilus assembly protein [Salmonella enterica]EAM8588736.1 pilus assembly protein [Salmonella enterica]
MVIQMKSIKKLIIASALSMMAASCYAGSFLPNSEQQKSVDIVFSSPQDLTVSLIPVSGLKAGKNAPSAKIAKLVVNSTTLKEFGVRGISNNVVDITGTAWRVAGKNTGKEIGVGLSSDSLRRSDSTEKWNGVSWMTFNSNDTLDIVLTGPAQNVTADTYPITLDVVGYQP